MLPETAMFQKILNFSDNHPDILAAYMNGSRTNPNAPKDLYQDYDIVYVVEDVTPYVQNKSWISYFGEIAVLQEPDHPLLFPSDNDPARQYAYLMQFQNGDRIDLTFQVPEIAKTACLADKLTVLLFDKKGILPPIPPASDEDYHVKPPTQFQFLGCCNEFWWIAPYVDKGLWRGELLYAIDLLETVRSQLLTMLSWQVGIRTQFSVSVGKSYKYLLQYLPPKTQERLAQAYPALEADALWKSLFAACDLMGEAARQVAGAFGFAYDAGEEERCLRHLHAVHENRYCLEESL